jgi:membrane protein
LKLVYGTFAAVPILLLWIYLSWLVVISGAVLAAVLPEWRERAGQSQPVPGSDFFDALQVLKILWRARSSGDVVPLSELHPAVTVRISHLETMLRVMIAAAWVSPAGARGWVLSRDVAGIKVEDVYHQFVFHSAAHVPGRRADPQLESLVSEISVHVSDNMQMSLEELFRQSEQEQATSGPPTQEGAA